MGLLSFLFKKTEKEISETKNISNDIFEIELTEEQDKARTLYEQALKEHENNQDFMSTLEKSVEYQLKNEYNQLKDLIEAGYECFLEISTRIKATNENITTGPFTFKSQLDPKTRILPHKNKECGEEFCRCLYIGHIK